MTRSIKLILPGLLLMILLASTILAAMAPGASDPSIGYVALNLKPAALPGEERAIETRFGVPFSESVVTIPEGGSLAVRIEGEARHIFLLGMTTSGKPRAWSDPGNYSKRYFVGDELGRIQIEYADGVTQVFPLLLGEGIWWGDLFQEYPEPFPRDRTFQSTLAEALRVYPPAPVVDGKYIAVITPRPVRIVRMTIEDTPEKVGTPVISAITLEAPRPPPGGEAILAGKKRPPIFEEFIATRSLRAAGEDAPVAERRLTALKRALYSSEELYKGHVALSPPPGYVGPQVSFSGNITAEILSNVFSHNVQDIADKIDTAGMYHTSTRDAPSWGGYNGFGTYRDHLGRYYLQSYARDLGRSLQELTVLGYTNKATTCADWCFEQARAWEENRSARFQGHVVPRHWGQVINRLGSGCFENDGHGLITLFIYRLWQRVPDRDRWLRSHWPDVEGAGNWIQWQFDHPELSQATDVLHTTGESADRSGYSVYADYVCMTALLGLAEMADSIGEMATAVRWRTLAEKMRSGMAAHYIITDPHYGKIWTLQDSGWTHHSTVLGPLIFPADFAGFAPENDEPEWKPVNTAAYQRLTDSHRPFGFYGQAMGYGQGFVTESALLLDRMGDVSRMLDWTARQVYDPRVGWFIVPEGSQIDPTGRYWYPVGDLGNGVQEAEIIKTLRIVAGLDDTRPERPQIFPRMPSGWTAISVDNYPFLHVRNGKTESARIHYRLERAPGKMKIEISADAAIGLTTVRLGPFRMKPALDDIQNAGDDSRPKIERSGDSWWVRCTIRVGPTTHAIEVAESESGLPPE